MIEVYCSGNAHEVGIHHGAQAKRQIFRSIRFHRDLFQAKRNMDWQEVKKFALGYQPYLAANWPQYVSEMEGVADGADVAYLDILALNVRTEIALGAFNDCCTALSWLGPESSILAQNWDSYTKQAENLIVLNIRQEKRFRIKMVTEAGIIGKIGMNARSVGCGLNAIRAQGVSFTKLPCHLALRTVLESETRAEAIATLEKAGVASACHILVADKTGGTGLECSSTDIIRLEMDGSGIVTHTNHFIAEHDPSVKEAQDCLADTSFRLDRINELLKGAKEEPPNVDFVEKMLKDEMERDGAAICRSTGEESIATLFSIVMDLRGKKAEVGFGKPTAPTTKFTLNL